MRISKLIILFFFVLNNFSLAQENYGDNPLFDFFIEDWGCKKNDRPFLNIANSEMPGDVNLLESSGRHMFFSKKRICTQADIIYRVSFKIRVNNADEIVLDPNSALKILLSTDYKKYEINSSTIYMANSKTLELNSKNEWKNIERYLQFDDSKKLRFLVILNNYPNIEIKDFRIQGYLSSEFFGENYISNGSFEVYNSIPENIYNGFEKVCYWQKSGESSIFMERVNLSEYKKTDLLYFDNLPLGSPDLIDSNVSLIYNKIVATDGFVYCRLHYPNFELQPKGELIAGEYLQIKLDSPLLKDSIYCLSLDIRLDPSSSYNLNSFGALFTEHAVLVFDSLMLQHNLHISDKILVKDYISKNYWSHISCTFKAQGNEKFVTLGCFNGFEHNYIPKRIENCESCYKLSPIVLLDNIELSISRKEKP